MALSGEREGGDLHSIRCFPSTLARHMSSEGRRKGCLPEKGLWLQAPDGARHAADASALQSTAQGRARPTVRVRRQCISHGHSSASEKGCARGLQDQTLLTLVPLLPANCSGGRSGPFLNPALLVGLGVGCCCPNQSPQIPHFVRALHSPGPGTGASVPPGAKFSSALYLRGGCAVRTQRGVRRGFGRGGDQPTAGREYGWRHTVMQKAVGVSPELGIQAAGGRGRGPGHVGRNHRAFTLEAEQRTCERFRERRWTR